MNVHKIPADHIAAQIMTAIREAGEAGDFIASISLTDEEFAELIGNETVKNTTSKWYGSNEGGMVLTGVKTQMIEEGGVRKAIPVLAYFNGVKIVRG